MKKIENALMSEFTTYQTGGNASVLYIPENLEELINIVKETKNEENRLILGVGSNILVRSGGYNGPVIHIGEALSDIQVEGESIICESGALVKEVSRIAQKNGLTGLEFAEGIPGSVGGGVYMNAGAYIGEFKDVIDWVEVIDREGNIIKIDGKDMHFGYRYSIVKEKDYVVYKACFKLKKGKQETIDAYMKEFHEARETKQPLEYPSCGSFFKRPTGYFAGKLIHDSGLRGYQIGGAQVSEKHCGFLINKDHATSDDILSLMKHIQKTVKEKYGVDLEPEVKIVGHDK